MDGWWNVFKIKPKMEKKSLDLPAMCVIQAAGGTMAGGLRLTRQCPPQTGKWDMPSLMSVIRCWWGQTPQVLLINMHSLLSTKESFRKLVITLCYPSGAEDKICPQAKKQNKTTTIGTCSPENMPWNKSKCHSCYRLGLLFSFQKPPALVLMQRSITLACHKWGRHTFRGLILDLSGP